MEDTKRDRVIIKTSIIGILANLLLAAFKAAIGLASHSIAIVMDAVNNLSDAASSVITIIGTKLAGKEADRKHPFGYGRVEYLSAMIISVIVLYAGITSLTESVKKIITPEVPDYSVASLIIVAAAVVVKLILGRYVKGVGEKVNSDSLVNSGEDARLDSVISASTLVAALIFTFFHVSLEAWLGALISLVIIKAGIEMLRETISKILGERAEAQLVLDIKKTVAAFPGVQGAYDLVLNNYGPDRHTGSLHIEVPDTFTADDCDRLNREIQIAVYQKHDVLLTAIGVYSVNTRDPEAIALRKEIGEQVLAHEHVIQMHGFYYNKSSQSVRFDVIVSFDAPSRREVLAKIERELTERYPDLTFQIALDTDYSEIGAEDLT
ncbi:MAG: cation diffusion facilitator family transporter [Firmicutes bacterium]|nr:cation diffusion facilitator family transporter [Bacillota bacterium]